MSDDRVPSTHTTTHGTLAVGWALSSLDPDEQASFSAHLETCPTCRDIVDETTRTLGELALAVEPVEPPAHLRRRLLDAVAAEPREGGAVPPVSEEPVERPVARDAAVVPRIRRRRGARWVLAAAAVLAVLAVVGLGVADQALRADRDAAAEAERTAPVMDVLRDAGTPGTTHATLTDPRGAMVGIVVDDGSARRLLVTELGPNGTDEIYVLWGLAEGTPRPLGTFDVAGPTPMVSSMAAPADAAPVAGFAVSLEPGRTAPVSPSRIIASGAAGP